MGRLDCRDRADAVMRRDWTGKQEPHSCGTLGEKQQKRRTGKGEERKFSKENWRMKEIGIERAQ